MDSDDFDQTQAIDLEFQDDTDDLEPEDDKKPVSFLKVLLQKGLNEETHPLYEGDNIVGRNKDTCHVHIPSKSLSKEHACIQIVGDVHMIFDKGSRNKTRRGKLFLSPDVRYELKDNEEIVFADVKCVYQMAGKADTVAESGTETDGSESLVLKYDVTDESVAATANGNTSGAGADDSVLPPTQTYPGEHSKSNVMVRDTPESAKTRSARDTDAPPQTLVLSESESEGEEDDNLAKSSTSKKPGNKADSAVQDTLLCEDSDPESSRDGYDLGAATQAYNPGHVDADDLEDDSSRHSLLGAATQAYGLGGDDNGEDEEEKSLMNAPTQAFTESPQTKDDSKPSSQISGTQSFKVTATLPTSGKDQDSADTSTAATQVFEEENDEEEVDEGELFAASTLAVDDFVEDNDDETDEEGEKNDDGGNMAGPDDATQVFASDTSAATVALNKDVNENSDTLDVKAVVERKQGTLKSDSCGDATMPVPTESVRPGKDRNVPRRKKQDVEDSPADLATQVIHAEADTLPVKAGEEGECDADAETQVFGSDTVAVKSFGVSETQQPAGKARGRKKPGQTHEAEAETVPVEDSKVKVTSLRGKSDQGVADTVALPGSAPTQVLEAGDTVMLDEPTQAFGDTVMLDEPTQAVGDTSSDLPTQVFSPEDVEEGKGENSAGKGKKAATHGRSGCGWKEKAVAVVSSDEDDDGERGEKPWMAKGDEPTQAYTVVDEEEDEGAGKVEMAEEATQAYGLLADKSDDDEEEEKKAVSSEDATQAYGLVVDKSDDENSDEEEEKKAVSSEDATQAYGLLADKSDDDDDEDEKMAVSSEEATQAYGENTGAEEAEDFDADATQDFGNEFEEDDVYAGPGEETKSDKVEDPTQNSDMSVGGTAKSAPNGCRSGEAAEESDDDSDLEADSVLKMDLIPEVLVDQQQVSAADVATEAETPGDTDGAVLAEEGNSKPSGLTSEPLSPEIPDTSTPVIGSDMQQLSDTEEMVPDSMPASGGDDSADTGSVTSIIPLPACSPLKSAIADRRRSPSPVRKRVAFSDPEPREEKSPPKRARGREDQAGSSQETPKGKGKQKATRGKTVDPKPGDAVTDENKNRECRQTGTGVDQTGEEKPKDGAETSHVPEEIGTSTSSRQDGSAKSQGNDDTTRGMSSETGNPSPALSSGNLNNEETSASAASSGPGGSKDVPSSKSGRGKKGGAAKGVAKEEVKTEAGPATSPVSEDKEPGNESVIELTGNESVIELTGSSEGNKDSKTQDTATAGVDVQTTGSSLGESGKKPTPSSGRLTRDKLKSAATTDREAAVTPEGPRVSSRGRRITTSSHLKDYDTSSKKPKRGGRSSLSSPGQVKAGVSSPSVVKETKPEAVEETKLEKPTSSPVAAEEKKLKRPTSSPAAAEETKLEKPTSSVAGAEETKMEKATSSATGVEETAKPEAERPSSSSAAIDKEQQPPSPTVAEDLAKPEGKEGPRLSTSAVRGTTKPTAREGSEAPSLSAVEASSAEAEKLETRAVEEPVATKKRGRGRPAGKGSKQPAQVGEPGPKPSAHTTGDGGATVGAGEVIKSGATRGSNNRGGENTQVSEVKILAVGSVAGDQANDDKVGIDGESACKVQKSRRKTDKQGENNDAKGLKSAGDDEVKKEKKDEVVVGRGGRKRGRKSLAAPVNDAESGEHKTEEFEETEEASKSKLPKLSEDDESQRSTRAGKKPDKASVEPQADQAKPAAQAQRPKRGRAALQDEVTDGKSGTASAERAPSPALSTASADSQRRGSRKSLSSSKNLEVSDPGSSTNEETDTATNRAASPALSTASVDSQRRGCRRSIRSAKNIAASEQNAKSNNKTDAGAEIRKRASSPALSTASTNSQRRGGRRTTQSRGTEGEESSPYLQSSQHALGREEAVESQGDSEAVADEVKPSGRGRGRGRKSVVVAASSPGVKDGSDVGDTQAKSNTGDDTGDHTASQSIGRRGRTQATRDQAKAKAAEEEVRGQTKAKAAEQEVRGQTKAKAAEQEVTTDEKGTAEAAPGKASKTRGRPSKTAVDTQESTETEEKESTKAVEGKSSKTRGRQINNDSQESTQESMDASSMSQPAGDSQASGRSRRGKRSTAAASEVTELSQAEESQGLARSVRGRSKDTSEKETRAAQSQPTPSPAKKARKSSPPPSTPTRKSMTPAAAAVNSPSLRKSTLNHQPKVMFTGVIDEQGEKILKDLGGELASTIQECTHLITDKIRRTVKFLGGLAKGALIVTPQWLESSKRAGTFLDGHKFLVQDAAMEKQYKFNLQLSIQRASSAPLLRGYSVHVTPSVRPDPSQMKDILQCAGAKYLASMPTKPAANTVVISCPDDQKLWSVPAGSGVKVMGAEFILTGILRQELQLDLYSLTPNDDSSSKTNSRGKGRNK